MKQLFLFSILSFINSSFIYAQNEISYTDSIEIFIQNKNTPIAKQVLSIEVLLKKYRHKNPEKYYNYSISLEEIGRKNSIDSLIARSYFLKGNYYSKKDNSDSATYFYSQAKKIYKLNNNSFGVKMSLIRLASVERSIGEYKNAIKLLLYSDSLNNIQYNEKIAVTILNNLGNIANNQKDYNSATGYYEKMISITENKRYLNIAYSNVAGMYMNLNQYKNALSYSFKSLKIKKALNIKTGLAPLYNNIGSSYKELKDYSRAELWLNKALNESIINSDKNFQITALNNLGNLLIAKKDFGEAKKRLNEAENILSSVYKPKEKMFNARYFNKLYTATESFKEAHQYLTIYTSLKDSLIKRENKELTEEFQTKYETKQLKQEKLDAVLNQKMADEKAKRSKFLSYGAISIAVIVALLLALIYTKLKLIKNQKKELDNAYEKLEETKKYELALSNLKAIRSQMNPHFIFNSLNSIQDLVLQQETDKSYDYIVLFADLVRSSLNYSEKEFIGIDKELDFLKVYLQLEKLRFGDELTYEVTYNGSLDIKTPSLVVQPFIENALLHGLLHKKGNKNISINFEKKDQMLCTIIDNGIGRKKAKEIKERQKDSHTSFSTNAIKKRMQILSDQYNMKAGFEYEDLTENGEITGTKVVIVLPFKNF